MARKSNTILQDVMYSNHSLIYCMVFFRLPLESTGIGQKRTTRRIHSTEKKKVRDLRIVSVQGKGVGGHTQS